MSSYSFRRRPSSNLKAPLRNTRRFTLPLSFEQLEDRCYLSASGNMNSAVAGSPLITEQQAMALAMNDLEETADGFVITNRQHTATLTAAGLSMEVTDGGPAWH